jgi:hypothetical protein
MDITYYAFATYIFLLLIGGVWFFAKVFRGGKAKVDKSSYEKEQRLFTMYQNLEDMLAGFEELAEETKKDSEEALNKSEEALKRADEMLKEVRRLTQEVKSIDEPTADKPAEPRGVTWGEAARIPDKEPEWEEPERIPAREARPAPKPAVEMEDKAQSSSPLKLNEKIQLLSAQGLMPMEIAKTLGVSVREVTLALELGRK